MASISKFNSALLSVPNELTVAAANFNINFSLMKVEAPREFHGLGDGLSRLRRHDAEEGMPHITARSLGALFESLIPPISHLTSAYGKRVSEISKHLETDSSHKPHTGIFSDRAGADGTSIWAAATSGQSAIAMHLLSCMLARIWKPAEATSLWVELVERRKKEIHESFNATGASQVASVMAAQQVFTRDQLSAWDASARSWLQTADTVKRLQQTQLMLIINNVRMSVNANKDPYESVTKAWISAMSAMERLICGVPQRVQEGAILLAISSWHLYPNMQVLTEDIKDVDQKDELMQNSLLTISNAGSNASVEGVVWSLPLSRMRYYSPPVVTKRHLASDTSRISMEEFQIVFLGAVIGQWRRLCSDEERCCKLVAHLYGQFRDHGTERPQWMSILAGAAFRVIQSNGPTGAQYSKLLRLGVRRCEAFLNDPHYKVPCFFGLEYFYILVQLLDNVEDRIKLLRRAAAARKLDHNDAIIRYKAPPRLGLQSTNDFEFASAVPSVRKSSKRSLENLETRSEGQQRLAIGRYFTSATSCPGMLPCQCIDPAGSCAGCFNRLTKSQIEKEGEESFMIPPDGFEEFDTEQFLLVRPGEDRMTTYELVLGDADSAALYKKKPSDTFRSYINDTTNNLSATMDEIEFVLASRSFNAERMNLGSWWSLWPGTGSKQQKLSFKALKFASALYYQITGATISIEVVKMHLYEVSWVKWLASTYEAPAQATPGLWTRPYDDQYLPGTAGDMHNLLERSFACLAWFESGEFDIAPEDLRGVFALANGDSIYVASALVSDPSKDTSLYPIRRVFGNIGRPEMSLLIPPSNPRLAEPNLASWTLINHQAFDGRLQNCFASTTLHLTFTDFVMPLDVGTRGLRDRQVVLLESLVSIDDRGRNIGDLDILSAFNSGLLFQQKNCTHPKSKRDYTAKKELVSLDCWDEFLDLPQSIAIFRASGNWQARLGAAVASIQAGKAVLVIPESPCIQCVESGAEIPDIDILIA
ncbi:hypothetical protein B0J11DRAFT_425484 [Dendryphion nanum]|uniref:Uncharacterized protein n=1 Tax=Dendryphion nanum TaxID=256645 RepID=A0A9P9EC84_9PLEO|nr:hypothetical protein B0J11DRAFT_425484 [Dendryphion nanum]